MEFVKNFFLLQEISCKKQPSISPHMLLIILIAQISAAHSREILEIDSLVKQRGPLGNFLNASLRAIDSVFSSKTIIYYEADTAVDNCKFYRTKLPRYSDKQQPGQLIASTDKHENSDSLSSRYEAHLLDNQRLCRLTIRSPAHDDSGYIACQVTNSFGSSLSEQIRLVHTTDILMDHMNSSNLDSNAERRKAENNNARYSSNQQHLVVTQGNSIVIPCIYQTQQNMKQSSDSENTNEDPAYLNSEERSQFLTYKWNIVTNINRTSTTNSQSIEKRTILGDDPEFAIDPYGQLVILQASLNLDGSRLTCIRTLKYDDNNILEMHGAPVDLSVSARNAQSEVNANTIVYPLSSQQVFVIEGDEYELKVIFSHQGAIRWKFNSKEILNDNDEGNTYESDGKLFAQFRENGRVLHITDVNASTHEGVYLAIHEMTGDFVEFKVKVKSRPRHDVFSDHVVPLGSEMKYDCSKSGKFARPAAQYKWYINSADPQQLKGVSVSKDKSTLIIDSVELAMVVQCEASNEFGVALNSSILVPAHSTSSALSDSFSNYFAAGLNQKASLPCLVDSDPNLRLNYTWLRNGNPISTRVNDENIDSTRSYDEATLDIILDQKSFSHQEGSGFSENSIQIDSFEVDENPNAEMSQKLFFNSKSYSAKDRNRFEIKQDDGSLIFRTVSSDEAVYTCKAQSPFDEVEVSLKFLISEELSSELGPIWLITLLICLCGLVLLLIIILLFFYIRQKRVYDLLENEKRVGRDSRNVFNSMRTVKTYNVAAAAAASPANDEDLMDDQVQNLQIEYT
ncbi:MAG: Contactin-3 [Marteilia pararefringens]